MCRGHEYRDFCVGIGEMTISGGNITGETSHGVYANASNNYITGGNINGYIDGVTLGRTYGETTLTIGILNDTIDTSKPVIVGRKYGVEIGSYRVNFYDGILKGIEKGYSDVVAEIPDAALIEYSTEVINGETYNTAYLVDQDKFVRVNGVEYNSLNKAIAAIETEGTIETFRSASIKSNVTFPSGKTITYNMNGYTLTTTKQIINHGVLTIDDPTSNGAIGSDFNGDIIQSDNEITINNITINKSGTNGSGINITGGSATIDNITLTGTGTGLTSNATNCTINNITASNYNGLPINNTGTMTIKNANLLSNSSSISNSGTMTIEKGTINASVYSISNSGNLTIEDGTFTANDNAINGGGNITIKKGTITSNNAAGVNATGKLTIEGGMISGKSSGVNHVCQHHEYRYMCVGLGDMSITNGTISGSNGPGVYINAGGNNITGGTISGNTYGVVTDATGDNTPTINIGTNNDEILTTPSIKGENIGLYRIGGHLNYYDGILTGVASAHSGLIENISSHAKITTRLYTENSTDYIEEKLVAEDDCIRNNTLEESYNNIADAISEASDNDKLELLKDIDIYYDININKAVEIDFKGYDIYTTKTIINSSNVTLKNTSGNESIISTIAPISIISNTNTLTIDNLKFENVTCSNYIISTNNNLNIKNSNLNGIYGISNSGTLKSNNTNITATATAFNNSGKYEIKGGLLSGSSYGIYSTGASENSVDQTEIVGSTAIYREGDNTTTISLNNIRGYIDNRNSGTLKLNRALHTGNLFNNASANYINTTQNGVVENNGTIDIRNSEISLDYNGSLTLLMNRGTATINDSTLKVNKTSAAATTQYLINNESSLNINNSNLELSDTYKDSTKYGIYNNGTSTINNMDLAINGGSNSYGVYSPNTNNSMEFKTGNVIVGNSTNAYGMYVNLGTITIGQYDGSGTNRNVVIRDNPYIEAIGSSIGIGVKKINGQFKYYDGMILGSTNAKPDTTTEVEDNFEVKFYNDSNGYEYSVLEYMEEVKLKVVTIGENKYSSLYDAYEAAEDGDTLILNADINESIKNTKNISINLNQFTLNGCITNTGTLSIYNGTVNSIGQFGIKNSGTITLGENSDTNLLRVINSIKGVENTGTLNIGNAEIESPNPIIGEYIVIMPNKVGTTVTEDEKTIFKLIDE